MQRIRSETNVIISVFAPSPRMLARSAGKGGPRLVTMRCRSSGRSLTLRSGQCSGSRPCSRCVRRGRDGVECIYETNRKEAKENMRLEIDRLRAQATQYDRVLRAIVSDDTVNTVRQQLKDRETLQIIANRLGRGTETENSRTTSSPLSMASSEPEKLPQTSHSQHSSISSSLSSQFASSPSPTGSTESWTQVTASPNFIEHLLSLYFCWEYPVFTILSEHHFRADMRQGQRQYCTPLLVNAILAVACRFSDRPEARTIPHDSSTAGDHFFEEAESLLAKADTPDLTIVQALGIMSIREAACGRENTVWSLAGRCLRTAIYLGLQLPLTGIEGKDFSSAEQEVRAITLWGSFALDQ